MRMNEFKKTSALPVVHYCSGDDLRANGSMIDGHPSLDPTIPAKVVGWIPVRVIYQQRLRGE